MGRHDHPLVPEQRLREIGRLGLEHVESRPADPPRRQSPATRPACRSGRRATCSSDRRSASSCANCRSPKSGDASHRSRATCSETKSLWASRLVQRQHRAAGPPIVRMLTVGHARSCRSPAPWARGPGQCGRSRPGRASISGQPPHRRCRPSGDIRPPSSAREKRRCCGRRPESGPTRDRKLPRRNNRGHC